VADFVDRRTIRRFKQTGFWCDDGQGDVCGEGDLATEEGFGDLWANARGEEIGGTYAGENTMGGGGDEKVSVGAEDEPTLPNVKPVLCFTRSSFGDPGHDNRAMFTDSDMVVVVLVMDDVGDGGICSDCGGISPLSRSSLGLSLIVASC
jgi:hypothetical protein